MPSPKFRACHAITQKHEGGYSTNRADPGNWTGGKVGKGELKGTKAGIAAASYPNLDIKNLTAAQIEQIYEREYWNVVRGDELPVGVDLSTYDYGVNSGNSRAIKTLQKVAGAAQDGKVGRATLAAVRAKKAIVVIQGINDSRLGFLQGLAIWKTFGKGWGARVGDVRARALLMAGAAIADLHAVAVNDNKLAKADDKKGAGAIAAGAGTGSGAAAGSVPSDQLLNFNWTTVIALAAAAGVLIVCGVVLKRRAAARHAMATATLAVMAEAA